MSQRSKRDRPHIDIHSHVISPAMMNKAGVHGPEWFIEDDDTSTLRIGNYKIRGETVSGNEEALRIGRRAQQEKMMNAAGDPLVRAAELDTKDIDILGVTIPPLFYFYSIDPEVAIPFVSAANDALVAYVAAAPNRFFFMPSLPLQDIQASVAEMKRCIALGARGVNIGAQELAGKELYSEEMFPLYELMEQQELPLFIHPSPTEIADGKPRDRYTGLILDYPFDCARAVNNLILGGVFDLFPNLKVYVSHGGGFIPYQFGRIETFAPLIKGVRCKKPPREYLKNFYFDTLIHELAARKYLVEWMGADNLVIGDNHGGMDSVDGLASVDEMQLDEVSAAKIKGHNARQLFKLDDLLV